MSAHVTPENTTTRAVGTKEGLQWVVFYNYTHTHRLSLLTVSPSVSLMNAERVGEQP